MNESSRTFRDKVNCGQARAMTSIIANTFTYALGCGLSEEDIKTYTGLIRTDLMDPESRLPEEFSPMIWKLLGRMYPGQAVPIHMASAAPLSFYGPLVQGIQYAATLRVALETLVKFQSVLSDQLRLSLVEFNSVVIMQAYHPFDEIDGGCTHETGAAFTVRLVREILGIEDALVRIEFAHRPFGMLKIYERFFGVPVYFQQRHNAVVLRRDALDWPTQQSDIRLFKYAEQNLHLLQDRWHLSSHPSPLSEIRNAITRNAQSAEYSAEALARQMNTSLRSLQRLTKEHGFTVRQLLDDARRAKARELLDDRTLSIEAISDRLGYSDARAFRRAFKRWTGQPPAEFRPR